MTNPRKFQANRECVKAELENRADEYYVVPERRERISGFMPGAAGESIFALCDDHEGAFGYYISASSRTRQKLEFPIFEAFLGRTEQLKTNHSREYDRTLTRLLERCRQSGLHVLSAVVISKEFSIEQPEVLNVEVSVIMPRFIRDDALQYGERIRLSQDFAHLLEEKGVNKRRIQQARTSDPSFIQEHMLGRSAMIMAGGSSQRSPYLRDSTGVAVE